MKSLSKVVLLITAVAGLAMAADKPNFSGDWKLNAAQSDFGPIPAPASKLAKSPTPNHP
jgi:hypothetical protein